MNNSCLFVQSIRTLCPVSTNQTILSNLARVGTLYRVVTGPFLLWEFETEFRGRAHLDFLFWYLILGVVGNVGIMP